MLRAGGARHVFRQIQLILGRSLAAIAAGEEASEFPTKSRERLKAHALGFVYILLVFSVEINESCRVQRVACAGGGVHPK